MFNFLFNKYSRIKTLRLKLRKYNIIEIKSYQEYLDDFGVFNLNKFEKYFINGTLYRGSDLFYENKIINFKKDKDIYKCNLINNNNKYDVMVRINSNDEVIDSSCNCEYSKKNGKNALCKHVGALITMIYHSIDVEKLRSELLSKLDGIKDILDDVSYIIEHERGYFKKDVLKQLEEKYDRLLSNYKAELSHVKCYNLEQEMVLNVRSIDIFINYLIKYLSTNLNNEIYYSDLVVNINVKTKTSYIDNYEYNSNFSLINLVKLKNTRNKYKNTIWDPDIYGLTDMEKEAVKSGNYNPWNFEENGDLEEDDYYYDDPN